MTRLKMRSFLFLFVTASAFVAGCWSSPVVDPLPPVSEIRIINAHYLDSRVKQELNFEAPPDCWEPIFAALRPARRDYNAAKWEVIGDLSLSLKNGRQFYVGLYRTFKGDGAFSAGESSEKRKYYRGGDSSK